MSENPTDPLREALAEGVRLVGLLARGAMIEDVQAFRTKAEAALAAPVVPERGQDGRIEADTTLAGLLASQWHPGSSIEGRAKVEAVALAQDAASRLAARAEQIAELEAARVVPARPLDDTERDTEVGPGANPTAKCGGCGHTRSRHIDGAWCRVCPCPEFAASPHGLDDPPDPKWQATDKAEYRRTARAALAAARSHDGQAREAEPTSDITADGYPRGVKRPSNENNTVQVLMPEFLARDFEAALLAPKGCSLSGPLLFSEDDLPTYIIGF